MLVLSRKVGESIVIESPAGPISIMVIDVAGNGNVRLGFAAPKEILILRQEILEKGHHKHPRKPPAT